MISAGASYTNTTISSSCLLPEPLSQCDHLQPYGGDVGLVPYNHFLSSSSFPHCQGNITTASTSIDGTIIAAAEELSSHSNAILYNLSVLTDKAHQLQSLVDVVTISPPRLHHHHHFNGELIQLPLDGATHDDQLAIAAMDNQIQDIILIASSMISTCQQLAISNSTNSPNVNMMTTHDHVLLSSQLSDHQRPSNVYVGSEDGDRGTFFIANNEHPPHNPWFPCSADNYVDNNHHQQSISNSCSDTINNHNNKDKKMTMVMVEMELLHDDDDEDHHKVKNEDTIDDFPHKNYEIVELKAEVLLAKYTHYCQVCGKGFKREANLKMHMRAHGDEYKSSTSLSNHMKNGDISSTGGTNSCYSKLFPRKYSCPHEGCRWNKKHPKFQPLKSMICVKNHYKRSHCPKMYICNRCNQKQFSVLSDLRTHEKHCGDVKWQCSCGTTFSRKDKLLGHCDLFFGHSPAGTSLITRLPVKFGIHTERIFVH